MQYCLILYKSFRFRSQWPRGLRRWSATARLLRLWVRIPPGAWMSVSCECCVLSDRGLCDEPVTRPEESYRLVRRCVWYRNLMNEEAIARVGPQRQKKQIISLIITQPTNALIVCHLFLNHFFKTLSLLLHVSIAYHLSSSGSTYSS